MVEIERGISPNVFNVVINVVQLNINEFKKGDLGLIDLAWILIASG